MTTSLAIKNAILYFGDNSSMMTSVCIIFIVLMSILGITIWREIVRKRGRNRRNSSVHSSEDESGLNWCSGMCVMYGLLILWMLAGEIDNNDGSLMVHGDLSSHQNELAVDCSHEDFSCCNYYDNCSEGPNDTIDYNTYVTTIKKGDTCPSFSSILYSRDHMLGYSNHDCDDTLYGCCHVDVGCDQYAGPSGIRTWEGFIGWTGNEARDVDHLKTYVPQLDIEGSNCKTVGEIINEYSQLSEKRGIQTVFKIIFLIISGILSGILGIFYMLKGIYIGIVTCCKKCREMRISCNPCTPCDSCNPCNLCKKRHKPRIIIHSVEPFDSSFDSSVDSSVDLEDNRSVIGEHGSPRKHEGVYDEEDAHQRLRGSV